MLLSQALGNAVSFDWVRIVVELGLTWGFVVSLYCVFYNNQDSVS